MKNLIFHEKEGGVNKKIERGLSLIEAAMVLALSAVVVAGVLYYYAVAAASNDNQKTIELIETIVSKVNALYANQSTTTGLSTEMIAKQIPGVKVTQPFSDSREVFMVVPGSRTGIIAVRGTFHNDNTYSIAYYNFDSSASVDEIYSQCMVLTGGQYGSSFISYENTYFAETYGVHFNQNIKERSAFCQKQKPGYTESNIFLTFRT